MRQIRNPPNPFASDHRELLEEPAHVRLEVYHDETREILSRNDSPDLSFRWSVNPYRGCFHACAYCYARPSHEYWGFGAGTDFESKIIVKSNAPELLRQAFMRSSWNGELIVFSGNTDCYQPLEATHCLTRRCLEICTEFRNPVGIITKSALVVRDLDVLQQLNADASVRVYVSIPFADAEIARKVEPQAPSPVKRFDALRQLSEAGIPTGISIAPVIPGLNEADIPDLLTRARDAGASEAMHVLLRLSGNTRAVFLERMEAAFPDRIDKIVNRIREVRAGALSSGEFFKRYKGHGAHWQAIEQLFTLTKKRLGYRETGLSVPATFRRPEPLTLQTSLF